MNAVKAIKDYVTKMIQEMPGMKVLLLDEDTTPIVSMVYTQSEILKKEVYLLERVANTSREVMTHLKAIVFVRPTPQSIDALVAELKRPKYGQYDIFFSNVVKPSMLEKLAEADEHEVVREVQEYFADYLALSPNLISFESLGVLGSEPTTWNAPMYDRVVQGLQALLLSLKRRPVIRYQASSAACKRLASGIGSGIQKEPQLFDFRQTTEVPPVLLIVDRRDDPVTPLLNQWTYQAMVHELLGIKKNRVDLKDVPNIAKDLKEVVLSSDQDDFYKTNMFLNFGEIGENIKKMVEDFQAKTKESKKMDSIADMKKFVESYPEFRSLSGSVSKHVSVVGELSRLVDVHDLLDLSACEQELACQSDHKEVCQLLEALLKNPKIKAKDRVRLLMLYSLRYSDSSSSQLDKFMEMLQSAGDVDRSLFRLIDLIQQYAGKDREGRSSDLFETKGAKGIMKKLGVGIKGIENVYTQHTPLLQRTLDQLKTGKLKEAAFPHLNPDGGKDVQDVFVFIVGGCTYAEARMVSEFNKANPGMRVMLGGTCVHNFDSFAAEMVQSLGAGGGR